MDSKIENRDIPDNFFSDDVVDPLINLLSQ